MTVMMLTRWSPYKGKMFAVGQVVEVEPEVAADLIQRGIAQAVRLETERPGQVQHG